MEKTTIWAGAHAMKVGAPRPSTTQKPGIKSLKKMISPDVIGASRPDHSTLSWNAAECTRNFWPCALAIANVNIISSQCPPSASTQHHITQSLKALRTHLCTGMFVSMTEFWSWDMSVSNARDLGPNTRNWNQGCSRSVNLFFPPSMCPVCAA